jgi:multidrug efflux pump subunit AcrA (membrane-fusion protein)
MGGPASKLEQLRINRTAGSPGRGRRVIGLSAAAVACLGIGAGLWLRTEQGTPVVAAETASKPAAAAESAAAPPAASVLDASGYVVARRQATVSSKITGKLVEVLVEEAAHAAGQ